jgi:hypothetical protein
LEIGIILVLKSLPINILLTCRFIYEEAMYILDHRLTTLKEEPVRFIVDSSLLGRPTVSCHAFPLFRILNSCHDGSVHAACSIESCCWECEENLRHPSNIAELVKKVKASMASRTPSSFAIAVKEHRSFDVPFLFSMLGDAAWEAYGDNIPVTWVLLDPIPNSVPSPWVQAFEDFIQSINVIAAPVVQQTFIRDMGADECARDWEEGETYD